jgi:hypothetical protein
MIFSEKIKQKLLSSPNHVVPYDPPQRQHKDLKFLIIKAGSNPSSPGRPRRQEFIGRSIASLDGWDEGVMSEQ